MRLDVFALVPDAFEWMRARRPLSAVLGTELELRVLSYRDTTPLTAGQVDDEPYGGGPGMVLRVDVVAAALEGVYGELPSHRVVALSPGGRQLDPELVEELAEVPNGIDPDQIAVGVCESWRSHIDTPDYFGDLQ